MAAPARATGSAKAGAWSGAPEVMVGSATSVGDLQSFPIKNPTTVAQEQMNRLLMFSAPHVQATREYIAEAPTLSYWGDDFGWGTDIPARGIVSVGIRFFNRDRDGLGGPLPHGALRVYEDDASGRLRYVGAAAIPDTPHDQKVEITLARAFDVFSEWTLVKRQRINSETMRDSVCILLHNEKATAVDVEARQGFGGRSKVVDESQGHIGLDADHVQWTVSVPAAGKATLEYTVEEKE